MSLYMNQNNERIYINKAIDDNQNQKIYKANFIEQYLREQKSANEKLEATLKLLIENLHGYEAREDDRWFAVQNKLSEVRQNQNNLDEYQRQMVGKLNELEQKNHELFKQIEEGKHTEDVRKLLNGLKQAYVDLIERLALNEEKNEEMTKQLESLNGLQTNLQDTLEKQEVVQKEIRDRLDNQEALTDKLLRQMNNIRSIIYERTNFLAGKIEEGYNITSKYIYKIMTGHDKPMTFFQLNHKSDMEQKNK
ncbi:hypothetical protein [Bacillus kwashiorkori]|uniref:hypothetical protein n=1 Tax=Bacillus kwashiorkori TaxID=1522318 RepID=UPI000784283F|nr:hypothetical protein [Bacillus kwashiorkori]